MLHVSKFKKCSFINRFISYCQDLIFLAIHNDVIMLKTQASSTVSHDVVATSKVTMGSIDITVAMVT